MSSTFYPPLVKKFAGFKVRRRPLLLGLLLACVFVPLSHAQRIKVGVSAVNLPETGAPDSHLRIDLGGGAPLLNAEVAANVGAMNPTLTLGTFEIEEGAGFTATISARYVSIGEVFFYVTDRRDEFVVLIDGRTLPNAYLATFGEPTHEATKTVTITVLNKARLKSRLGGGQQAGLVGAAGSPYLQPVSGPQPEGASAMPAVYMNISLGAARNGQALPPLLVGYIGGGYVLPAHSDIIPDPANTPTGFPKKYLLPQARLTITADSFRFSAVDDDTHALVTYTHTGSYGTLAQPGTPYKWTREFNSGETSRVEEANLPLFAVSGTSGAADPLNFTVEDWHQQGATAARTFTFHRSYTDTLIDDVVTKNGSGVTSSANRIEYQQYDELFPDDPDVPGIVHFDPKRFIQGYGSSSPVTAEQLLTATNQLRGSKQPDGNTASFVRNEVLGTTIKALRTMGDTSPGILAGPSSSVPSGVFLTEYTYAADWTGLDVLPSTVTTKADGKLVGSVSNAYVLNQEINFDGRSGMAEKYFTTTTTVADGASGLVSVSKKFQGDTLSLFYADLPFSQQNPDGTKVSYAYQRGTGTILSDGSGFNAVSDSDINQYGTATYVTRTVTISGVKKDTGSANLSTSSALGGIVFDELAVVDGRSTATVEIRRYGFPVRLETWVYTTADGFQRVAWENLSYTPYGGLTSRITSTGATYTAVWDGYRRLYEIDASGQRTDYTYDAIGRVASVTREAVTSNSITIPAQRTAYTYDADDRVTKVTVGPEFATEKLETTFEYTLAGELQTQTTFQGTTTRTCTYSSTGHEVTTVLPTGATKVEKYSADGRLKEISGSAVVPSYYSYGFDSGNHPTVTVHTGSSTGRASVATYDLLGRVAQQQSDGFIHSGSSKPLVARYSYNSVGQLSGIHAFELNGTTENQINADTLFSYDIMGGVSASGLDLGTSPDGALTALSRDRFTFSERKFVKDGSNAWWAQSTTKVYYADDSAAFHSTSSYSRLTGLSASLMSETVVTDLRDNSLSTRVSVDTSTKTTTEITTHLDHTRTVRLYAGGFLIKEKLLDDTADINAAAALTTSYSYDALGRRLSSTDSRGIVSRQTYKSNTALVENVYGHDANNQEILLSTFAYDSAGRLATSTNNAKSPATSISYGYNSKNQVVDESGTGTNPAHHVYNEYGQRTELWTWRSGAGTESQADKTFWTYDANTGALKTKTDAAAHVVAYDYTYDFTGGRKVVTRQWARGTVTTYRYKLNTGELSSVDYSDGTPSVDYDYTRTGQVKAVDDATGTRSFDYDHEQLAVEHLGTDVGNWYHGLMLTTLRENGTGSHSLNGRYRGFQLGVSGTPDQESSVGFGYDGFGRISGLTAAYPAQSFSTSFSYQYHADSFLWEKLTHGAYTIKREFEDSRDVLTSISAQRAVTGGDSVISAHFYQTNNAGEREAATQGGSAFADFGGPFTTVKYAYDGRSQLENATSYLGGDPFVVTTADELPGRKLGYAYDLAGNRDHASVDAEQANYYGDSSAPAANSLNQVKQRDTLKTRFSGAADTAATVTVDGSVANRRGRYWDRALDGFGQSRDVTVNTSASETGTRTALVRPSQETFEYDQDGNLKKDALWEYFWDGENRLIGMSTRSDDFATLGYTSTPPNTVITFVYDYRGRRVSKKVIKASATTYHQRYVYDDWNLIAEFDPTTEKITRSYVWGLDVSGSLVSTGGIGALVLETTHASGGALTSYDVAYDGNGNVTALVGTTSGTIAAAYEYDPFGQIIRSTGAESKTNPFRFSTKFTDQETALVYYGLRYYDPSLGRFINRDPSEESGGNNLYGFAGNDSVNGYDYLGLTMAEFFQWLFGKNTDGKREPGDLYIPGSRDTNISFVDPDYGDSRARTPAGTPIQSYTEVTGAPNSVTRSEQDRIPPFWERVGIATYPGELRRPLLQEIEDTRVELVMNERRANAFGGGNQGYLIVLVVYGTGVGDLAEAYEGYSIGAERTLSTGERVITGINGGVKVVTVVLMAKGAGGVLSTKSVTAPFKTGDIIVQEFATSKGTVEMAAEVVIDGRKLVLKDIAIYPKGAEKLKPGTREMMVVRDQLAADAKAMGFDTLQITGKRLTGAKPGKLPDVTIDLTK
jgi:RHS repeat-associated protein